MLTLPNRESWVKFGENLCSSSEEQKEEDGFMEWNGQNHLQRNISRPERWRLTSGRGSFTTQVLGEDVVDMVGITINKRLDCRLQTKGAYKRGMSKLF